ncbi:Ycf66 family protein [Chamaesiphon sp. GL140_3_metabinner_50]|uniref:Ycf66 family protein n=1 Tax=Chamaesiphon sp. GL140_3_metabinner_50 TaxID=2970812 RepID=UPI0025DEF047|nr:Ycf66 family protein [Chamaesiphon sp. GL140_3_metabinner_50]
MSFGISAATLLGLVLMLASLSLFLTNKFKPDLHQESDNIYAIVGFICGLLLVISFDLGAAMAFQQLLMIGSLITIMWQFIQVRAENKQLKGGSRSAGREAPSRRSGYTAQIDDEPEYASTKRSNRRNKDRFDRSNNESEDRDEFPYRRATRELPEDRFAQTAPRRRLTEPSTEVSYLSGRQNDRWDEEDWNDGSEPVQVRRALPDADLASTQSQRQSPRRRADSPVGVGESSRSPSVSERRESSRIARGEATPTQSGSEGREAYLQDNLDEPPQREWDLTASADPDANPRRRRRPERDPAKPLRRDRSTTGQVAGTTANYVDYEPLAKPLDARIDPPSGLPPSGSEPIVFPDRY